ncbi:tyrosine phosphatase [Hypoxylon sp. NC1633]|nr:tyrosine phosphatase [Hypoxylon sp. NC1633]
MATQTPQAVPFVDIPGVLNFRDIGGYAVSSQPGKVIRRGLVFRSSEPSKITDDGISRIQQLGIKHVYDLRSLPEITNTGVGHYAPVKELEGSERIFAPVFLKEDYSPEAIAIRNQNYGSGPEGFIQAYMNILASASSPSNEARPFARILSHLASDEPTPILAHCSAGKDRTGVICALVLSLCGVSDEDIALEYNLTDLGLKPLHGIIVASLMHDAAFRDNPEGAKRMILAQKETMLGTLKMIRSRYGSVEKCVTTLGLLSVEGIDQLRRNLIVEVTERSPGLGKDESLEEGWVEL